MGSLFQESMRFWSAHARAGNALYLLSFVYLAALSRELQNAKRAAICGTRPMRNARCMAREIGVAGR